VPQGAILSQTLYNIFTSDVPTTGVCELATFADESAIFVSDIDRAEVCGRLQRQLNTLSDCLKTWKIRMNPTMLLASGIKLGDQEIPWSSGVKYLGLYLDKRLTFTSHTVESIKKGRKGI
jgi:hypothetical protein